MTILLISRKIQWMALVAVGLIGFISGCSRVVPSESPAGETAGAADSAPGAMPAQRETWDLLRIAGARAGYAHTAVKHVAEADRKLVKVEQTMHLAGRRFSETTEQDIRYTSTETPGGRLLDFRMEIRQGRVPLVVVGKVAGNRLELEMATQGKTMKSSTAWSPGCGGMNAPELSLLRRPMQPGEKRTVRHLGADNALSETEMTAAQKEPVQLLAGSFELLRIDISQKLSGGQTLKGAVWADGSGDILKSWMAPMNMEMFRATKELATAASELPMIDLGEGIAVKLDRPLDNAHEMKQARYRVQIQNGNPDESFVNGPSQQVKRMDAHTAEVTVCALRPGQESNPDAADAPPADADRQPNNFIQSDDAKIVADARQAAGRETDPWRVAVALERFVHDAMTLKGFKQAFATAAEAARTHEGDCKAHAVYLAALARAQGIPSRVAVGLVYMSAKQAFGYHMWTEVYVDRRWIPLDATLALGGIGAGHLKLGHGSLEGPAAYTSFLPVLGVVGRLKIEVRD
jgi:hypothetical protein